MFYNDSDWDLQTSCNLKGSLLFLVSQCHGNVAGLTKGTYTLTYTTKEGHRDKRLIDNKKVANIRC